MQYSCVAERQIILSLTLTKCLITVNVVEIYIPPILSIDFSLETRQSTTRPTFDTATAISWCVVTDGSMLYSLPRSGLVHTADSCENEGRFSFDRTGIRMHATDAMLDNAAVAKTMQG